VAALPARPVERPHAVGAHLARVIGGPAAEWGRLVMPARIPRRGCDRKVAGAGFAVRLTAADRSRQSYSARSREWCRHGRFRRKLPLLRTCFDASRTSICPRDHFCRSTMAPR
jgi:hypothetical protein